LRGEAELDPEHPVRLFRRHYADRGDRGAPKGVQYGVRVGEWKYIERPDEGAPELYDLRADPTERRNLIRNRPEVAARLSPLLVRWGEDAAESVALSPEEEERLRALGYVE
jgi:arylsulfatase A-like enzyme